MTRRDIYKITINNFRAGAAEQICDALATNRSIYIYTLLLYFILFLPELEARGALVSSRELSANGDDIDFLPVGCRP